VTGASLVVDGGFSNVDVVMKREGESTWTARIPTYDTIDHIGVTVPDLDAAVEFFTSAFGAEPWYGEGPSEDPRRRRDVGASCAFTSARGCGSRCCGSDRARRSSCSSTDVPDGEAAGHAPRNSDHSAAHIGFARR